MTIQHDIKPGDPTLADEVDGNFSALRATATRISNRNIVDGSIDTRHLKLLPQPYRSIHHTYWQGTETFGSTIGAPNRTPMTAIEFPAYNGGAVYIIGSIKVKAENASDMGEVGIKFMRSASLYFPSETEIRASVKRGETLDIPFHIAKYYDYTGAYSWTTQDSYFDVELTGKPSTTAHGCLHVTFQEISVNIFSLGV